MFRLHYVYSVFHCRYINLSICLARSARYRFFYVNRAPSSIMILRNDVATAKELWLAYSLTSISLVIFGWLHLPTSPQWWYVRPSQNYMSCSCFFHGVPTDFWRFFCSEVTAFNATSSFGGRPNAPTLYPSSSLVKGNPRTFGGAFNGKNHRKILENLTIKWRFQWDINYI